MNNILLKNVHVINLERSKDRLQHIDANLSKFNIKYKRFNAIDAKKLSMKEINENTTEMCRYLTCNKSVIGCGMSHYNVWNIISKSVDKWHLILEDDIEFTEETIKFLDDLSDSSIINEDDIIISLVCNGIFCSGSSINLSKQETDTKINKLLVKSILPMGFPAYLITKNTAKKLYDYITKNKINYFIDLQISWNVSKIGINYYTTKHNMIKLSSDNDNTTIGSKSLFLMHHFLHEIGLSNLAWNLSGPFITLGLTVTLTGYILIYLILLALNFFIFHSIIIYIYLLLELVFFFILLKFS